MDVSIIIVSYNVAQFLNLCLSSVAAAIKDIDAEVIIVDNNSVDQSVELIKALYPSFKIIENKDNVGFSKANNQAVKIAKGKYVHFLNPDTILPEDFYTKSLAYLDQHENVGCLGPKILDADGKYAFDSKKSFPSFWVSVYKLLGLAKFFPNSHRFNAYYAAHVDENETAAVDILSGCCLLVRKEALDSIGGGFDEQYFMYCEDVDMCHSIQLNGYENVYYPAVSIVHFKGESTKKLTVSYMKIFYQAHALFINKYYPKNLGTIYNKGLKLVLGLRNVWTMLKHVLSIFKLYIIDALVLTISLYLFTAYWHDEIVSFSGNVSALDFVSSIPIYIIIWIASLYFNGAYDKPYSLFRAGRGMLIGSVVVLAIYGLMPLELRFSRGVMFFNGLLNTFILLIVRVVLNALNIITLVPRGKYNYKSSIVSDEHFDQIKSNLILQKHPIDILGRIGVENDELQNIGNVKDLSTLQEVYGLHEIIIDTSSMDFKTILSHMYQLNGKTHFKFVNPILNFSVSSDTKKSYPLQYALDNVYNLGMPHYKRNKRILDIVLSIFITLLSPVLIWFVKDKNMFLRNIYETFIGKKTWVGYKEEWNNKIPKLRKPVVTIIDENLPVVNESMLSNVSEQYALKYNVSDDLVILLKKLVKK